MNAADMILIAVLCAAVALAVRQVIRTKKNGRSCCGTAAANSPCEKCGMCKKTLDE